MATDGRVQPVRLIMIAVAALILSGVATVAGPLPRAVADPPASLVGVDVRITAAHSTACLDVMGGTGYPNNGTPVQQWECLEPGPNQVFTLVQLGSSSHFAIRVKSSIVSGQPPKCLDVPAPSNGANGTKLQVWDCNISASAPQQLWEIDPVGSAFRIRSVASGRCLDIEGGASAVHSGARVQIWDCSGSSNQTFYIRDNSPTASTTVSVVASNISGDEMEGQYNAIDSVNAQINSDTDIVLVVEACWSQYQRFMDLHPGWDGHFRKEVSKPDNGSGSNCVQYNHATDLGAFVASPHPLLNKREVQLPGDSAGHDYGVPCAEAQVPNFGARGGITACAVKLIFGGSNDATRSTQAAQIRQALDPVEAQRAVVIGGDFNAIPSAPELNSIYRLTNSGQLSGAGSFYEGDQRDIAKPHPGATCSSSGDCRGGQYTHKGWDDRDDQAKRKFDYVFFGRHFTLKSSLNLTVFSQPTSGHEGTRASATMANS